MRTPAGKRITWLGTRPAIGASDVRMQTIRVLWTGHFGGEWTSLGILAARRAGRKIGGQADKAVSNLQRGLPGVNQKNPRVSLAIPVYNEEAVVPELLRRTTAVLDTLPGGPHEIVLADDGSSDRTFEMLEKAAKEDDRLVIVALSRNFGHQTALTAALDHVTGDVAILMDGDLQDPPEALPTLLEAYQRGYDVVYVRRVNRKESWWLKLCYYLFYRLLAVLSSTQLPLDAGDFGLMSRRVIQEMRRMPEHHRYLRGMRTWVGFRQIGIPIERSARHAGRPKYSPIKLLMLAFDGIFAFSIVPLRAAAILGVIAIFLSGLFSLYSIYVKFWLHSPQGFTAMILAITFLSGVNLFFLGVIGEYVGRVYEETKARPHYVVGKVVRRQRAANVESTIPGGAEEVWEAS
jgi:polyisoprenyl-phosphate glycosyltransferase